MSFTFRRIPLISGLTSHVKVPFRSKFTRAEAHVILLQDVPEMGKKGEIVQAPVKYARTVLVPGQLAYYVPKYRGQPLLPAGWEPKLKVEDLGLETILPAMIPEDLQLAVLKAGQESSSSSSSKRALSGEELRVFTETKELSQLAFLKRVSYELTLYRRQISKDSDRFFGSVSPEDVSEGLNALIQEGAEAAAANAEGQVGSAQETTERLIEILTFEPSQISIEGGKLKSLGKAQVTLHFQTPGLKPVGLNVNIVPTPEQ